MLTSRASNAIILFSLAMGGFAIGTTEFASMSLLPFFTIDLGINDATASHVISAYALGVVLGAPILAVIGARCSRRKMLLWLMAAFAVGHVLSAFAPTYGSMLVFRFLSGMPHGAYFGVAALVAASLVPANKRAQAVSKTMLGLTVATIIGVPFANAIGQHFGWRWGFGIVAFLALATVALVCRFVPHDEPHPDVHPLKEIKALRNKHIWITLAVGAIGFGGLFAVYTYVASTLIEVTKVGVSVVPLALAIFGLGMTVGTIICGHIADRLGIKAAGYILAWSAINLCIYPFVTDNFWAMCVIIFFIGNGGGLGTILQTHLMDVAGDAQTLAASLNHSAFNFANALGPLLAGLSLSAGFGFSSTGFVGCALAASGLLIWVYLMYITKKGR
jgi:DHA1 family inner membrane transport protein